MSRSHEREDGNMGDGTPSESDMRDVYTGWAHHPMGETEAGDEFDRVVSKIKADAWDDAWRVSTLYTFSLARWNDSQRRGGRLTEPEPPSNPHR